MCWGQLSAHLPQPTHSFLRIFGVGVAIFLAAGRKKLGSRPGSNTYILNELGVGYRMIEEDAKPLEPAEETK